MKIAGRALMILSALALAVGAWLLSPAIGWIALALVLYTVGYHLSRRDDDGPTAGAAAVAAEPADAVQEAGRRTAEAVRLHQEVGRAAAIRYGVAIIPRRIPEA